MSNNHRPAPAFPNLSQKQRPALTNPDPSLAFSFSITSLPIGYALLLTDAVVPGSIYGSVAMMASNHLSRVEYRSVDFAGIDSVRRRNRRTACPSALSQKPRSTALAQLLTADLSSPAPPSKSPKQAFPFFSSPIPTGSSTEIADKSRRRNLASTPQPVAESLAGPGRINSMIGDIDAVRLSDGKISVRGTSRQPRA